MRFSYGKFGSPIPKKIKFAAIGITSNHATARATKKVNAWLNLHAEDIVVYRSKTKILRSYFGLVCRINYYIFYKNKSR
jgi:hypothetical protein